MHGPSLAILLVVLTLGSVSAATSSTADALAEARVKLADGDAVAAVTILEAALPDANAGAEKSAILDLLGPAYDSAAKQAQAAGHASEAETYRENLKILNRKPRPTRSTPADIPRPVEETPAPAPAPARPATPTEPIPPTLEPASSVPTLLPDGPTGLPTPDTSAPPALPAPTESKPVAPPSDEPASELAKADAAFIAENYSEAGRIYSKLAKEKQLPAERRDQWFYCRAFAVVSRINARPRTESEWANLNTEIDQLRALSPKNYLGEYLRNLAAERQGPIKKPKASKALVVRGSAPEEPVAVDRPVRPASNITPASPSSSPSLSTTPSTTTASRIGAGVGRWQVLDTANFRIYHTDPSLAARVAQAAEAARRDQLKRWARQPARTNWQPLCEIYLYPTAKQYATMTGQPEDSPGFSTMGMNSGRITSRRVNLRADHPTLVQAVLPHEITHVILADYFTERQIPRWADEGMAVLSEPVDEQRRRAADLIKPLAENRLFAVDVLMSMDYPDERYWSLYYAQSVSLTRFLVEQGTPTQMVQFLQESQREGYETALRRIYKIEGFVDLQRRWIGYARSQSEARDMAANPPADGPDLKVR